MKILFINPNLGQTGSVHHGIASLAATVRDAGHETALYMAQRKSLSHLKRAILNYRPDIICFSIVSNFWEFSCFLADDLFRAISNPYLPGRSDLKG